jgi:hypothetical protein
LLQDSTDSGRLGIDQGNGTEPTLNSDSETDIDNDDDDNNNEAMDNRSSPATASPSLDHVLQVLRQNLQHHEDDLISTPDQLLALPLSSPMKAKSHGPELGRDGKEIPAVEDAVQHSSPTDHAGSQTSLHQTGSAPENAKVEQRDHDPHSLRPYYPMVAETARRRKRREWQEARIKASRAKSQSICKVKHPDRSLDQQKAMRELCLCASCLRRTVPQHEATDIDASCVGKPSALWDDSIYKQIRGVSESRVGQTRDLMDESAQVDPSRPVVRLSPHPVLFDRPTPPEGSLLVMSTPHIGGIKVRSENIIKRSVDVGGIDPPTPDISEIRIDESFETSGQTPPGSSICDSSDQSFPIRTYNTTG